MNQGDFQQGLARWAKRGGATADTLPRPWEAHPSSLDYEFAFVWDNDNQRLMQTYYSCRNKLAPELVPPNGSYSLKDRESVFRCFRGHYVPPRYGVGLWAANSFEEFVGTRFGWTPAQCVDRMFGGGVSEVRQPEMHLYDAARSRAIPAVVELNSSERAHPSACAHLRVVQAALVVGPSDTASAVLHRLLNIPSPKTTAPVHRITVEAGHDAEALVRAVAEAGTPVELDILVPRDSTRGTIQASERVRVQVHDLNSWVVRAKEDWVIGTPGDVWERPGGPSLPGQPVDSRPTMSLKEFEKAEADVRSIRHKLTLATIRAGVCPACERTSLTHDETIGGHWSGMIHGVMGGLIATLRAMCSGCGYNVTIDDHRMIDGHPFPEDLGDTR